MTPKPPYRLPSMAEIAAIPLNGYTVASTFSGCGGSSLGYRLAGFKVVWANEFIPAAQETYRANFPRTPLNPADIRKIQPADVLFEAGIGEGELDVLDGSPPCSSFSMAGSRAKAWGEVKAYSDTKQRTDDLFHEYIRLLKGLKPRVFVAENVSGLVKGVAKGQFLDFLDQFKRAGYRTRARLLDAQWLGVPQARQRLIFVGVRDDLGVDPAFPAPLAYRYSVRDALPWIGAVEGGNGYNSHAYAGAQVPSATIQASRPLNVRTKNGIRSGGEPAPTVMTHNRAHTHGEMTVRLEGGTKAPFAGKGKPLSLDAPLPTVIAGNYETGPFQFKLSAPPVEPEADMRRYSVGRELDKIGQGEQSERYFQLTRAALAEPSPTITAEGRKAHAASVAHPTECRKFSIAELRAICGFPPDFVLTGTYAQQWERLGRAVPPPMMAAIATAIRDNILAPLDRRDAA